MTEQIIEIDINKIKVNPNQPRKDFDKEKLGELADSIETIGQINPIQVKKVGFADDEYELICGERRLKAHKLKGKKTIKAIVKDYNSKEDEMIESIVENLHRTDLNSVEKENFITVLWKSGKYKSYAELGKAVGLFPTSISGILSAKQTREKTCAAEVISTRTIQDVRLINNIEDKKKIFQKVARGDITADKVRNISRVISKAQPNVKQAFFSNNISIEQADKIFRIKDDKVRNKLIDTHKKIKSIDKSVDKNITEEKPKTTRQIVKTNEVIDNFRNSAIESQKSMQSTIKSLVACFPYISLMDSKQISRLNHFQELLETTLANAIELSENLKERIKL